MNNRWITPGNPMRGHGRPAGPSPEWLHQAEVERALAERDGTTPEGRNRRGLAGRVRDALGKVVTFRRAKR